MSPRTQPARRRQRGEDVDRGAHRIGIGVVAVVDQRDARRRRARSASPASGRAPATKRCQAAHDRLERAAGGERGRARRQRIADVVRAGRCAARSVAAPAGVCIATIQWSPCQHGAAGDVGRRRASAKVSVRRAPAISRQVGACASSAGKTATPSAPSAAIAAAVLARDRVDAGHELEVLALRVVDERDRRRGDLRQAGDLAGVVHAELDHRGAAAVAQAQQRQRQADVVVEVALGRERGIADRQARKIAAIICVTVVLPLLPVTATSGMAKRRRQAAASSPRARRLSATSSPGSAGVVEAALGERGDGAGGLGLGRGRRARRSARRAGRRRDRPGATLRVSLWTREIAVVTLPTTRAPGSSRAASSSVIIGVAGAAVVGGRRSRAVARRAPRRERLSPRAPRRRTAASRRRCPGSPRGPCRR